MKLALCCGINYVGTGSDLAGCVNDAADWEYALIQRGYEVSKLLERDATATAIMENLARLIERLTYGDILVFTFSGHGSWVPDESGDEPDGRDEIICPYDITEGVWITDDQIAEVLKHTKGARVIMISDSCHSGSVSRMSTALKPNPRGQKVRFLPPSAFMNERDISDVRGFSNARASKPVGSSASVLLSGCRDREFSYDAWFGDRANGAFTRAALDALGESPATYRDWHKKIRTRLPSAEYPQTPQILASRGDMKKWPALGEGR